MPALAKAGLYCRTLRFLRPSQIVWRLWYTALRKGGLVRLPRPMAHPPAFDAAAVARLRAFMERCAEHAPVTGSEFLRQGKWRTFNAEIDLNASRPWDGHEADPIPGRIALHYFDCTRELALAHLRDGDAGDHALASAWVEKWIEQHPAWHPAPWGTFQLACRVINWGLSVSVLELDDDAFRSAYEQHARFLLGHLEYDVLANHLLKNAVALVVAGALLGDCGTGKRAADKGLALLLRELDEQILPDGGHYEHSLMYHCHVLEDLLIVHATLSSPPAALDEAIAAMARFLDGMLHPDGEIPLFSDGAFGTSLPPGALLALSGIARSAREACRAYEASGFYVMTTDGGGACMMVKASGPDPAYQMAHAQADMASYELSVNGERLVVDAGVSDYTPGPWREYARGTRAHNTVSVNGIEQLECWASFRVARRYTPTVREWGRSGAGWRLHVSHDGLAPYTHERLFVLVDGAYWLVRDRVTGPGAIDAESCVHLHPEAQVTGGPGEWTARRGDASLTIVPFGANAERVVKGETNPRQGWYCPRFGETIASPALILTATATSETVFGYALFPTGHPPLSASELAQNAKRLAGI